MPATFACIRLACPSIGYNIVIGEVSKWVATAGLNLMFRSRFCDPCSFSLDSLGKCQPRFLVSMMNAPVTRKFTTKEYHQLTKLGFLDRDGRTELIGEEIVKMPVQGMPHEVCLSRLLRIMVMQVEAHSEPLTSGCRKYGYRNRRMQFPGELLPIPGLPQVSLSIAEALKYSRIDP